ncbi:hypothetical protein ACH5RR_008678 [Cinchona calisaya]|uniref:Uncharacterized protein n=1 Tax=Cinchona calisaya TaxID=153742 RepID=A0ABD3AC63_9GENT
MKSSASNATNLKEQLQVLTIDSKFPQLSRIVHPGEVKTLGTNKNVTNTNKKKQKGQKKNNEGQDSLTGSSTGPVERSPGKGITHSMSKGITIGENVQIQIEESSFEEISSPIKDSRKQPVMTTQIENDRKEKLSYEAWEKAQKNISALVAEMECFNTKLSQQQGKHVLQQQMAIQPFPTYAGGNGQVSCSTNQWGKFYPNTGSNRQMNSNPWGNSGLNIGGNNVQAGASMSNIDPNLVSLINDMHKRALNHVGMYANFHGIGIR